MKHPSSPWQFLWAGVLAFLPLLTGLAAGQAFPPAPAGPANPLDQPPVLSQAAAPAWVKPGMRLSYYSSAALVPPGDERYTRDDKGDYFDQQGNFYSRAAGGGGGHGYTQVTVAGLDATTVALDVRSYGFPQFTGPLALIGATAAVGAPGNPADWWMSPAIIQRVITQGGPGTDIRIIRGSFTGGGATYQAIWFYIQGRDRVFDPNTVTPEGQTVTSRTARHMWAYDEGTGILLLSAHAVDIGKGIGLNRAQFVSARQLQVPWAASPAPPWIAQASKLAYTGAQVIPFPGGRGGANRPMTATIAFGQRGTTWTQYKLGIEIGNIPGFEWRAPDTVKTDGVTGTGQFGGMWVPPEALATLRQGQLLDQDPVTRVEVRVAEVTANAVAITESTSIQSLKYTYDRGTGIMVQYDRTDPAPANIETHLRFARQE